MSSTVTETGASVVAISAPALKLAVWRVQVGCRSLAPWPLNTQVSTVKSVASFLMVTDAPRLTVSLLIRKTVSLPEDGE